MRPYLKLIASCSALLCVACSNSSAPNADIDTQSPSDIVSGVFYDDDGDNCIVFISDERAHSANETQAKSIIMSQLQGEDFEVCDSSEPRSAGLYTIVGLDEYDQPDWETSTEYHFFKIEGWSGLVTSCSNANDTESCETLTQSAFLSDK